MSMSFPVEIPPISNGPDSFDHQWPAWIVAVDRT
jgi:hypothetical protein